MLEIRASRAGPPTAIRDGVALQSLYDPVREAGRFVATQTQGQPPGAIVILGEVLGHLWRAAAALHPTAKIIVLFYEPELARKAGPCPHPSWHPGLGGSAQSFLRGVLSVLDLEGLLILSWPPSRSAYAQVSATVEAAVAQTVRELNGSVTTTLKRGRRWLRNSVLNALHGPPPAPPPATGLPVVIAASGPSLEDALPLLRGHREGLHVWALPSAVCCLLGAGVEPDLVVMTDPGYYAVYHLHPAAGRELAVAMPLSACPGVWRVTGRVVYLAQPTFYETALLQAIGIAAPLVSLHGTVAGTALELALTVTAGTRLPVVMAGLDLCLRDIRSHCRPNCFDRYLEPSVTRVHPMYHQTASLALEGAPRRGGGDTRTSLPLDTYAGWFAAGQPTWEGRVRRLHPSPVELEAMPPVREDELADRARAAAAGVAPTHAPPSTLPPADRGRSIRALLGGWRADIRASGAAPEAAAASTQRLAHELGLGEMIEIKSRLRRGDTAGARRIWAGLARSMDTYLEELEGLSETEGV